MSIRTYCRPTLINCEFLGNRVGGNFWRNNGTDAVRCLVANNRAENGYLYEEAGSLANDCQFLGNRVNGAVDMIQVTSTAGTSIGNVFDGNVASGTGGFLLLAVGNPFADSAFANNSTMWTAGILFAIIAAGNMTRCTFSANMSAVPATFSDFAFGLVAFPGSVARGNLAGGGGGGPIADFG